SAGATSSVVSSRIAMCGQPAVANASAVGRSMSIGTCRSAPGRAPGIESTLTRRQPEGNTGALPRDRRQIEAAAGILGAPAHEAEPEVAVTRHRMGGVEAAAVVAHAQLEPAVGALDAHVDVLRASVLLHVGQRLVQD